MTMIDDLSIMRPAAIPPTKITYDALSWAKDPAVWESILKSRLEGRTLGEETVSAAEQKRAGRSDHLPAIERAAFPLTEQEQVRFDERTAAVRTCLEAAKAGEDPRPHEAFERWLTRPYVAAEHRFSREWKTGGKS